MNDDDTALMYVRPEQVIRATLQVLSHDIERLDEPGDEVDHLLLRVARRALANALTRYYLPPGS